MIVSKFYKQKNVFVYNSGFLITDIKRYNSTIYGDFPYIKYEPIYATSHQKKHIKDNWTTVYFSRTNLMKQFIGGVKNANMLDVFFDFLRRWLRYVP